MQPLVRKEEKFAATLLVALNQLGVYVMMNVLFLLEVGVNDGDRIRWEFWGFVVAHFLVAVGVIVALNPSLIPKGQGKPPASDSDTVELASKD